MTVPASSYPLLGIGYFIRTPKLWLLILCHLIVAFIVITILTIVLLAVALPLQGIALANSPLGPAWGWTLAVFLTIAEVALVTLLLGLIYIDAFLYDFIFDQVLLLHKISTVPIKVNKDGQLGRFLHPILYGLSLLFLLPLQLIPIIGQILIGLITSCTF